MLDRDDRLQSLARACATRGWRLARTLAGNAADADDVMQQAFMVAMRKHTAIPRDDAWPWFAAVIAHEARNLRRKRARLVPAQMLESESAMPGPLYQASTAEIAAMVGEALQTLPELEREAVTLVHIGGLTFRDAATAADLPTSTLNSRVQNGLSRLRQKLRCEHAALLACLPAMPVESPPTGMDVAVSSWLAAAHRGARLTLGGSSMLKVLAGSALVGAVLLLVWSATTGLWQPRPPAHTQTEVAAKTADNRPPTHNTASRGPESPAPTPETPADATAPNATPENGGAKPTTADPVSSPDPKPDAPATAADVTAVRGRCFEATRGADGKLRLTEQPIAGATVWAELHVPSERLPDGTTVWPPNYEDLLARAASVKMADRITTSAADGSWSLKNLPTGLMARLYMGHPDFYCTYASPAAKSGASKSNERNIEPGGMLMTCGADHADLSEAQIPRLQTIGHHQNLGAERGVYLVGTVTDIRGSVIAGATLHVHGGTDHLSFQARSGANGQFRVGPFLPGCRTGVAVTAPKYQALEGQWVDFRQAGEHRVDFELAPGGVVRGLFVPAPGRTGLTTLIARCDHESNLTNKQRHAHLNEHGEFLIEDLDAGGKYRVSVGDPKARLLLAMSELIVATPDGAEVRLEEVVPAEVSVSVDHAAFDEKTASFVLYVVPEKLCRDNINDTLRDFFWSGIKGKEIKRGETLRYQQRVAMTLRLMALPADMAAAMDGHPKFTADDLKRLYVSDAATVEPGKNYDLRAGSPLLAASIRVRLVNRNDGALRIHRRSTIANFEYEAGAPLVSDDKGCFSGKGPLWPGEYDVFWAMSNWPKQPQARVTLEGGKTAEVELTVSDEK